MQHLQEFAPKGGRNMAKHIVAREIPKDEVDGIVEMFRELGATDVVKTEQPDKTFTVEATFA